MTILYTICSVVGYVSLIREPLLKGKVQYSWPPSTNSFRSAAFDLANIIHIFTKQATL